MSTGDKAGHTYTAVPQHDLDDDDDVSKEKVADRLREQSPDADAAVPVKTSWPVKTRWLLLALVLLALPVVVPCSYAAVSGHTCPDYWKGAGVFLFCGTLWASEVRFPCSCSLLLAACMSPPYRLFPSG